MDMEFNAGQGDEEEKPPILKFDKKVTSAFLGESNRQFLTFLSYSPLDPDLRIPSVWTATEVKVVPSEEVQHFGLVNVSIANDCRGLSQKLSLPLAVKESLLQGPGPYNNVYLAARNLRLEESQKTGEKTPYRGKTSQNSSNLSIQVTDYHHFLPSKFCSFSRNLTGERRPSKNWSFTAFKSPSDKTLTGAR